MSFIESNYLLSGSKGKDEVSFCIDGHQNKLKMTDIKSTKPGAQFHIMILWFITELRHVCPSDH